MMTKGSRNRKADFRVGLQWKQDCSIPERGTSVNAQCENRFRIAEPHVQTTHTAIPKMMRGKKNPSFAGD